MFRNVEIISKFFEKVLFWKGKQETQALVTLINNHEREKS
jgi:hypothetical protein